MNELKEKRPQSLRERLHEIIFEADTSAGKFFDVSLLIVIVLSILVVMLESVKPIEKNYGDLFDILEWVFTIIFTIEYILRLYSVFKPWKYATSFFGVIDLLATLPSYITLFLGGAQYFVVIRILRLLRVFRIFKLGHFMKESGLLIKALKASRARITVFLMFVVLLTVIIGSIMYLLEGESGSGFSSIPRSVYWAIVTLTTVGYGDITPVTALGQFFSAIVMILGYAIIAVPTGIITSEIVKEGSLEKISTQACRYCGSEGHDTDAVFCKSCGEQLNECL